MRRFALAFVIIAVLCASGCRTKSYSPKESAKRGDVVYNSSIFEVYNLDRIDKFLENVNNKVPDSIRITSYGDEGMYLIQDVSFDGKEIEDKLDSTMAYSNNARKREKKKFSGIKKDKENINDENGLVIYRYIVINKDEEMAIFVYGEKNGLK